MTTLALIIDPWRYTVLALACLALGVSLAVLRHRWTSRWRYAQIGVCLTFVAMIVTTLSHLGARPLVGVYVEIAACVVYVVGHYAAGRWIDGSLP